MSLSNLPKLSTEPTKIGHIFRSILKKNNSSEIANAIWDLINKRHGSGICNSVHHGQTIHPIENLIYMNLLQMSFMIT